MRTRIKINNKGTTIKLTGKLIFDPIDVSKKHSSQSEWKKTAFFKVDGELCNYYRWFLNKNYGLHLLPTLRRDHITFISDRFNKKDISRYQEIKKKYNNKKLTIDLDISKIYSNGEHWWFDVYDTDFFKNIRISSGFKETPYHGFHMTIGYANAKSLLHSKYLVETFKLLDL